MNSLYTREFILSVTKGYFPPLGFAKLKYISVSENARYADIRLIVGITGNAPPPAGISRTSQADLGATDTSNCNAIMV
jgi:hypothetical protein